MPAKPAPVNATAWPERPADLEEPINDLRRLTLSTHLIWETISPGNKCSPVEENVEANIINAHQLARRVCDAFYERGEA